MLDYDSHPKALRKMQRRGISEFEVDDVMQRYGRTVRAGKIEGLTRTARRIVIHVEDDGCAMIMDVKSPRSW